MQPNQYPFHWTDERMDLVKKLWSEGLSASQIASRLGSVTRNAVIGKVHRLGLQRRKSAAYFYAAGGRERSKRIKAARPPAPPAAAKKASPLPIALFKTSPLPDPRQPLPGAPLVSFHSLDSHHCRWMHGDRYCGCTAVPGLPYCAHHARVAYQPPQVATRTAREVVAA